jgi:hypothetical protein
MFCRIHCEITSPLTPTWQSHIILPALCSASSFVEANVNQWRPLAGHFLHIIIQQIPPARQHSHRTT